MDRLLEQHRVDLSLSDEQALGRYLTYMIHRMPTRRAAAPNAVVNVIWQESGELKFGPMIWRLIPLWAKTVDHRESTTFAQLEHVRNQLHFRKSIRDYRCVVPLTTLTIGPGSTFRSPSDSTLWAAAIWTPRRDFQESGEQGSFAILTVPDETESTSPMHSGPQVARRPVLLPTDAVEAWCKSPLAEAFTLATSVTPPPLDRRPH